MDPFENWCPSPDRKIDKIYRMSARADPKNPARAEGTSYVSNKNNLKSINLDISETTSTLPRINHLSETKEYRLIQGYLIIKGPNGHNLRARVAIDTQSNVKLVTLTLVLVLNGREGRTKLHTR